MNTPPNTRADQIVSASLPLLAFLPRARRRGPALRRMRGFALGELVLALVVISLIFASGFLIYRSLNSDTEGTRQTEGIIDLLAKSKETFGLVGGNWTAYTQENLIKMNRIPLQFTKDATTIYDAFKNPVVFAAPVAASGTVSFQMRSPQECVQITQRITDLAYIAAVGAAGSETAVKTAAGPLDIAALATGCAATPTPTLKITIR